MNSSFIASMYILLDACIVSLVLVFASQEAGLPIALSWLIATSCAVLVSVLLFTKTPYQIFWGIGISSASSIGMWAMGGPIWLVILLGFVTFYLLHGRYSSFYEAIHTDHHFLIKFLVVFSVCWFFLLINPNEQSSTLLFVIAPVAVIAYVFLHLLYHVLNAKSTGARIGQAASVFGILLTFATFAAIVTSTLADEVRSGLGKLLGSVIRIVFWPLALALEQVNQFLSGLSTEEDMQETIDQLGPDENTAQQDTAMSEVSSTDFPVEILLGIVIFASAIVLLLWLRKTKIERARPEKTQEIAIKRHETQQLIPVKSNSSIVPHELNLHQIRELFRELEKEAHELNKGRASYETIREWMSRMQWNVADSFYHIYDRVRYGDKQLPEEQVRYFIDEIEKIKNIYLKEHV